MLPPSEPNGSLPDDPQLQALFDAMPQLGWAARPDGWIYYYNRRWYEYTGSTPEAMAGWGWQAVHEPSRLPLVMERWTRSIATVQPFEMSFQLRRYDGEFRWFLTRINPMRDEHGRLIRWVGINTDIHDQKEAEEAAAAASRAKDEFLAMLGHELRNPLAPIVTAVHLMELRNPDMFRRERAIIARQTAHLSRLVDDLLDVARFLRGDVGLRRETFALDHLAAEALEMLAPRLQQSQHHLHVDVPAGLQMEGDFARLKQVVVNLLTNAIKYTPPGGDIRLNVTRQNSSALIRVEDNGIGIAPALLPEIFDPFVQKHQSLARSEGGLGVGLAIVRSIVTAHGGSVEAQSEGNGRGSVFTVRLPLAVADAGVLDTTAMTPGPAERLGASRRILVVDDNVDAADSLAAALDHIGHVTHVCYHARSALEAAEAFAPDVALLDLGLPGLDGYELARRFREHPRLRDMLIVAVTGYGSATDRERTQNSGFDHHFVKPVDLAHLLAAIDADVPAARTDAAQR